MFRRLMCLMSIGLFSTGSLASAQDKPQEILSYLDGRYEATASLARNLWDFAEVGYKEEKSSALMKATLEAEGFTIQSGVAGIPTAFVASFGTRGPVIGILAEYDALPGINQSASPTRQPIEGKAAGHACGHNLFGAGSVSAAIAVKHWLEETGKPGIIRLYGTPAEEGGSGKVYLTRAGLFKDVDTVLHWHPGDRNRAKGSSSLANRSVKFRFSGISAHAAASPEKARSALDGVEAFNMMINLMREHVPQETRIHYVITQGGLAPNVVPDFAEVYYYIRHPDAEVVKQLWERITKAAKGAAMGTGTQVKWEVVAGNHALMINETLAQMVDEKLRLLGGIDYTKQEQAFADTLYASLNQPSLKVGSEREIQPLVITGGRGGSTDVGDVSMSVPTVGFSTATWVAGTSAHSWQAVAAGGMTIGFKGAHLAAKTLTLSAIELFVNEALRKAAWEEFDKDRGKDFHYEALLGDREPALDYRD